MKVVISPHLDDAVLSYGGALALETTPAKVVTVFAGKPPTWPWPTPFDSASGFRRSSDAVMARRDEDRRACEVLGVEHRHLPWLDGQYGFPRDHASILQSIESHLRHAQEVVVPLGLAHPDHRLLAQLCRRALAKLPPRPVIVYAELPAHKLWPSHVNGALRGWTRWGWSMESAVVPMNLVRKQRSWECYASQLRFPELAWENLTKEVAWEASIAS